MEMMMVVMTILILMTLMMAMRGVMMDSLGGG